ncbi:MAG: SAM-dependent methyltransferase [Rhodospirillaceae bacterium]|nr:SAM-dependent methyltransferase [Rhodospirillaceae bacterium]|tara:strand:+ start:437 stop:1057 length:621 start_codon:yes stop_codon:yes gene_type:complete
MLEFLHAVLSLPGSEVVALIVMIAVGVLIGAYTLITGVPPMPTSRHVVPVLLDWISEGGRPRLAYDLGCGWGRIAFALASQFPETKVVGIELSPVPWLFCRLRLLVQRRPNLEIRRGDFLKMPLGDADLVFCYLMIKAMRRLQMKLDTEAAPGAIVISNSFAFPDWRPQRVEIVSMGMSTWLYLYRVPTDGLFREERETEPPERIT